MLELIFNPFFDQPVYSGEEQPDNSSLRKKYVGKLGLLEELKLRLGLTSVEISDSERLVSFYKAVNEADLNDPSLFFHESFSNDPLGVAAALLKWRDALVYAGWKNSHVFTSDPSCLSDSSLSSGAKAKFVGLAAIEEIFSAQEDFYLRKGTSDFWMDILKDVQEDGDDLSFLSISVAMTESLLKESDPMLYYILSLLSEKCQAHVKFDDCELENENQKVHLFTIPDQLDAYQWLFAGQHEPELQELDKALEDNRVLLINEDNVSLNGVFDCLGKPHVESQFDNVNTSLLQLFRNGLTQFRKPVDFKGLQDYLSSPYHPLGDFKIEYGQEKYEKKERDSVSLSFILLDYLSKQNGFGKNYHLFEKLDDEGNILISFNDGLDWNGILDKFVKEGVNVERDNILSYTGFWDSEAVHGDHIRVASICAYCTVMSSWCRGRSHKFTNNIKEQLLQVASSFETLESFLSLNVKKDISYDDLMKYVDSISSLSSFSGNETEVGTMKVVASPASIAEHVNGPIVWLDCYDKKSTVYSYDFLLRSDIELLCSDMKLPTLEEINNVAYESLKRGMNLSDDLYIVYPIRAKGSRCEKHLFYIEKEIDLKAKGTPSAITNLGDWKISSDKTVTRDVVSPNTQEWQYSIDCKLMKDSLFPNSASATSLKKLFDTPFDYLMKYVFNLSEYEESRISTIKGSVAHLFIQNAFVKLSVGTGTVSAEQLKSYCQEDGFDEKVDEAAKEKGAILFSPENRHEYARFKYILKQISLKNLISIMEQYHLRMVGSEYSIDDKAVLKSESGEVSLHGSIDCIMETQDHGRIIFDFKWTESKTGLEERKEEVENHHALQLAIYHSSLEQIINSEIIRDSHVDGVGYYMLRTGTLITDCNIFTPSDIIEYYPGGDTEKLIEAIGNLYHFRMDEQLKKGIIEDGDDMKKFEWKYPDSNNLSDDVKPPIDLFKEYVHQLAGNLQIYPVKGFSKKENLKKNEVIYSLEKESYGDYRILKGNLK